ncbi:hypothetical protein [Streptomyces sp. AC555_RSS877]|uniref:hypothetical protein n=1 Tax=Streptomyces sp. AC555_RSS877 TaxID=2823688 RepID=UPI001C26F046|nr:hypothetical protein [Streptomyces sp. AC555_RSS877]
MPHTRNHSHMALSEILEIRGKRETDPVTGHYPDASANEITCNAAEGNDLMTRVLVALTLTAYIVGYPLCVGVAVDVITQHPYDWVRTGSTQKFRIFLIFAPLITIGFIPLAIATSLFYLGKVRPQLTHNARVAASQGWPPIGERPTLGLNWAWHEAQIPQKVKTILSASGATFFCVAITKLPPVQSDPPQWLKLAALAIIWPSIFIAAYMTLSIIQLYLHFVHNVPLYNPKEIVPRHLQALMQKEYIHRVNDFHKRQFPQTPWSQQPWRSGP